MERQLCGSVRTSLSASELEDVFAEVLVTLTRPVGSGGAFPADASRWNDNDLRSYAHTALVRAAGKAVRRHTDGDGQSLLASTALDDLGEQLLTNEAMWSSDARPAGPEESVLGAEATRALGRDLRDQAGFEAAQLMFAEAAGYSAAEQRDLLDLTVGRRRRLGDSVALVAGELRSRLHAVLLWPVELLRWISGWWTAGGAAPRIGVVGVAVAAVIGGGGAAVKKQAEHPRPQHTLKPALAQQHRGPAAAPQIARASAMATQRITAEASRARAATARRRAKQRAAHAAASGARRSVAATQFSPQTSAPSALVTVQQSTSSSAAKARPSVAQSEFEPGG
jgi:hypothetical protein